MIKLKKVSKFYYSKGIIASGFSKVDLDFHLGEFVAITGESGSGKSTLLNVISGLDSYEEGEMYIDGKETSHYTEKDFEDYRRKYISNIFQNFNLVNSYTVYQNIELVLLLNGFLKKDIKEKVLDLIKKVDLYAFRNTKVSKLSGGQKQRVAIARALAKDTPIILADEPTGSLDSKSAKEVVQLLSQVAKDRLVIIVTHNYEQVEPFVTRKIKMHDGRVLEDKKIKKVEVSSKHQGASYKNITGLNRFRLGIRNAFNIIPKFLLILAVYLFVFSALLFEYSAFKQEEYIMEKSGYNSLFKDTDDKRIIVKKKDKTSLSDEDYNKLKEIAHVKRIVKNDLLLDTSTNITDSNNYWIYGSVLGLDYFDGKLDAGRMPKDSNEIVVTGMKNDYYIRNLVKDLGNSMFYVQDEYTGELDKSQPLKVVGIQYIEDTNNRYNSKIFVGEEIIDNFTFKINQQYSKVQISFRNLYYDSDTTNSSFKIIPVDAVYPGDVYVDYDLNPLCKNNNCLKESLTIEVSNLYYQDSKTLTVAQTYSKANFKSLFGFSYDEENKGAIYINSNDYKELFNKDPYQSSIFVDDVSNVSEVSKKLEQAGYHTLLIKDTLEKDQASKIIQIFKTVVTIVLVIALFFISYFVIQLILKSRNNYFSILRMLGATKKVAKHLLIIELLVVSNLAFWLLMGVLGLYQVGFLPYEVFRTVIKYLTFYDYVLLFVIMNVMAYFISLKFSKKLFKKNVMTTMKEEV